jgi:spore coat polysaccharide biosynthesis protein SpsF
MSATAPRATQPQLRELGRVGVIIQARMGSRRLPGKVVSDMAGRPILHWVVERAARASLVDAVIVATSTDSGDDPVARLGEDLGAGVFRGSERDVLARFAGAAERFGLDTVIRVTADCPLLDPELVDRLVDMYAAEGLDYGRIDTDTFPRGLDAEVFSGVLLMDAHQRAALPDEREHVTVYFRRRPDRYRIGELKSKDPRPYRITVDTPADLAVVRQLAVNVRDLSHGGISAYLDANPDLAAQNAFIEQESVNLTHPYREAIPIEGEYTVIDCIECGFWHVFPSPPESFLKQYYTHQYTDPLEKVNTHDKIATIETLVSGRRVLDVGCGDGALLREFKEAGWDVAGIEPGRDEVDPTLDIRPLTFDDPRVSELGRFDAVVVNFVLEHYPEPIRLLDRIRGELLVPGGILVIEVPNDFNPLQLAVSELHTHDRWWIVFPDHLNYFSARSLHGLLERLGYRVVLEEASFPLEMFALMGDVYIGQPEVGKQVHQKRVRFETALRETGRNMLRRDLYQRLAELEIGRTVITYATT